jgi:hypothetical protein
MKTLRSILAAVAAVAVAAVAFPSACVLADPK